MGIHDSVAAREYPQSETGVQYFMDLPILFPVQPSLQLYQLRELPFLVPAWLSHTRSELQDHTRPLSARKVQIGRVHHSLQPRASSIRRAQC